MRVYIWQRGDGLIQDDLVKICESFIDGHYDDGSIQVVFTFIDPANTHHHYASLILHTRSIYHQPRRTIFLYMVSPLLILKIRVHDLRQNHSISSLHLALRPAFLEVSSHSWLVQRGARSGE